MTTVRCGQAIITVSIILSVTPAIKSTVDHGLVKKYFVDLYNEALVRATAQEQGLRWSDNTKEQGTGVGVRRSQDTPFIPYSNQNSVYKNYSPQSGWKASHKHKHNTHFHKHREVNVENLLAFPGILIGFVSRVSK